VEDGITIGGLGAAVEEYLQNEGFRNIPVKKLGVNDMFVTQGTVSQLHHLCGIDADSIAACGEHIRSLNS
jgi:1-deoxy-D-xylulose-5-phosphate synthase